MGHFDTCSCWLNSLYLNSKQCFVVEILDYMGFWNGVFTYCTSHKNQNWQGNFSCLIILKLIPSLFYRYQFTSLILLRYWKMILFQQWVSYFEHGDERFKVPTWLADSTFYLSISCFLVVRRRVCRPKQIIQQRQWRFLLHKLGLGRWCHDGCSGCRRRIGYGSFNNRN